jgi:hypothetical protein
MSEEKNDSDAYAPQGCTCKEEGAFCKRCVKQRERIARIYRREKPDARQGPGGIDRHGDYPAHR